ncbi:MAG: PAS domain-containing protein [Rhodobacteraceae bacterium]|nr:MAG: PAS domain-containing protein [Paracoccaceae bacterium]
MLADLSTAEITLLLGGTLLGALLTVLVGSKRAWRPAPAPAVSRDEPMCFLFRGSELIDATGPASILAEQGDAVEDDAWHRLRRALEPRFGDLPDLPSDAFVASTEFSRAFAPVLPEDSGRLVFARAGDGVRISLVEDAPLALDRHLAVDVNRELRFLRSAIADAPNPIWAVDQAGRVTWCNRAYSRLAEKSVHGTDADTPIFPRAADDPADASRRLPLTLADSEGPVWFDVSIRPNRDGFVAYASNVDAVVRAEQAQRNFVQTLTKTFAHLSTGLAIFDRSHRLALFNPALIDLTAIPVEFLTAKPSLEAFFDYLREHQIMPEPKNYPDWRERIGALLAAARDGRYCKTWNLPSGLTYRVTGKPHPDGAVAFLFEDISAEISLTRRFRAELETSQAVLDRQDRALAVFSQTGTLTFSNDAFREMWRFDPDSSFAETTITDVLKIWQSECAANVAWNGLPKYVASFGERVPRRARVAHRALGALDFAAEPLPGGATLMSFQALAPRPEPSVTEAALPLDG